MGKDSLEKIINKKLEDRAPDLDYSSLWEELEPRLPKRRRNPFGFLLLSLVLIVYIGIGLYNYNMSILHGVDKEATHNPVQENFVDHINTRQPIPADEVEGKPTTTPVDQDIAISTTANSATSNLLSSLSNPSDPNVNTAKIPSQDISLSSDSQLREEGHPKTDLPFSKSAEESFGKVANNLPIAPASSISDDNVDLTNTNPSISEYVDLTIQKDNKQEQKPATTSSPTMDVDSPATILHTDKNEGDYLNTPRIPTLDLREFSLVDRQYKMPGIIARQTPEPKAKIGMTHMLNFSTGALIGNDSYTSQSGDADYENSIRESLTNTFGYNATIGYRLQLSNGFFAGIEGSYDYLFQKFEVHNEVNITREVFDEEAFTHNGNFIGAQERSQIITSQDVLKYNTYTHIDLIPQVGYTWGQDINLSLAVGPILNIHQGFSGKVINPWGLIIEDTAPIYSQPSVLQGAFVSLGVDKYLTHKLSISTQLRLKLRKGLTAANNSLFDQNQNSLGLNVGLGYRL